MTALAGSAQSILGFDPFDPAFRADPYSCYRALPDRLFRTPAGVWVTASYELCGQVLRDPRFGHGSEDRLWTEQPGTEEHIRSFLVLDPPDHTRLRRLVSKAFTARLVERLRPRIQQLVDTTLDALLDNQPLTGASLDKKPLDKKPFEKPLKKSLDDGRDAIDVISALAYPLPVIVISELLGVPPDDRARFKSWSDALARGLDPDFLLPPAETTRRDRARAEFASYFKELADQRRTRSRDDLLSALVAAEERGDTLSPDELIATCILLLVAGHETTVNLIGNGTLALLRNPDQLAYFHDHPACAPAAVEELLRYDSPVQLTGRIALEDAEIDGTAIGQGELVLLLLGAANRDPAVFPDPDRLDLRRTFGRHLAFGLGIHFCLGAPLARLEGEITLAALARRAPRLAPAADVPVYKDNLVLRGLASLPVYLR